MNKKADIVAVAKAARVSISTVSRSFNHPELVKAGTRKKIDAAVRKLGYIRNRAAQTIHGIRSGTVGLIVPTVDHTIFAELIQSFSDQIEAQGFTILLASHGYDLEREYALVRKMLEHRVDGMALIGGEHARETFELLGAQDTPAVLLWNYAPDAPFASVGPDNFEAGALIGTHVASLGHRDVGLLFPPLRGNDRATQRMLGVQHAFKAAGVHIAPERMIETPYSIGAAKDALGAVLTAPNRPTALICGNDVLAWGAVHAMSKAGLQVPDDMSICGIGDFKGSREFEPALTTVRIPARQIGKRGADMMAAAVTGQGAEHPSEVIAPELMERQTCCRLGAR